MITLEARGFHHPGEYGVTTNAATVVDVCHDRSDRPHRAIEPISLGVEGEDPLVAHGTYFHTRT